MRYLGSKTSLLDEIINLASHFSEEGVFCDPFGGIGTVGNSMKKKGYQVITGDVLYFAHCFQTVLIEENAGEKFDNLKQALQIRNDEKIEQYLNNFPGTDGWLVEEYGRKRKFFTEENAKKIQTCLTHIQNWNQQGVLVENEYEILIASLIQSLDKVANTAGTYYAYLKEYYRKAKKPFEFQLLQSIDSNKECKAYLMDANQLVKTCKCNILYLDPPYNERDYRRYYHLPENIATGTIPVPLGKSGIYVKENSTSSYNKKSKATVAFTDLIKNANADCIIFHYTDKGLIDMKVAKKVLQEKGVVEEFYFDSKGYNTKKNADKTQHHIMRMIR